MMLPKNQKVAMSHRKQMTIWGYDCLCLEAPLRVSVIVVPLLHVLLNCKGRHYSLSVSPFSSAFVAIMIPTSASPLGPEVHCHNSRKIY